MKDKAYQHGYNTGLSGGTWFDCPYLPTAHRFDFDSWMRGHADGLRDRKLGGPQTTARDPYDLGYKAGLAGASYFECPFLPSSHQYDYKRWMSGHANGLRDRKLGQGYESEWSAEVSQSWLSTQGTLRAARCNSAGVWKESFIFSTL